MTRLPRISTIAWSRCDRYQVAGVFGRGHGQRIPAVRAESRRTRDARAAETMAGAEKDRGERNEEGGWKMEDGGVKMEDGGVKMEES